MNLMDLFITISAKDEASDKIKSISGAVGNGLKTAAKIGAAAVAAVAAGAAALTKGLIDGAKQVAAYGDNIDKMSQKMGLSTDAYQEWDFVLQHCGTSIDSMQRGMMTLTTAAETGKDAFNELGISQEQLASMSQEELFAATIEGLQGIDDEGQRAVLAQQLLGASAKELGPLLNTSAEDVEAMRQQVHDLGGVMSQEAVKAAAGFQDSLQNLKTSFTGVKNSAMTQFLPAMSSVMDGLTQILSGNKDEGVSMITEGIHEITQQIVEVLPDLIETATTVLTAFIEVIAANLPDLIRTLLPVIVSALVNIIGILVSQIPAILSALWDALKVIGQQLWPVLQGAFSGIAEWFSGVFGDAWEAIKAVFSSWGDFFKGLWNTISSTFSELGTKLGDAIGGAVKGGVNAVLGWIESTVNDAIGLINSVLNFINNIPGVSLSPIETVSFPRLAIGLDRVPMNNYLALLHKDEAILNPIEAEDWRRGKGRGKSIENNFYFNGVAQSDLDYICAYVDRELNE